MAEDIVSIGIRIDSSQTKVAIADLDKLAAVGTKVEKSTDSLTKANTINTASTRQVTAAIKEQAKATEAVAKSQTIQATAMGNTAAAVAKASTAAARGAASFNSFAAGQKLSAYQSQQLSFQLNDLFVQIASGQSPITALIQQGSQLSGTFGGIGGALRAVGSLFTATRVVIGGVVGTVAAVAGAFISGRSESDAFAKSIALTGNAAGVTEGRFNSMAEAIAATTSTSIGSARETLQAFVNSGQFSGAALEAASRAAQSYARVTGRSTDDVIEAFVKAGSSVAAFARQTNAQYHHLSAAQLDYIKTLDEQGNTQRALELTFDALNRRLDNASQNLGILERAWNAVKVAASNAIEAMKGIGRVPTPEGQIADLRAQLDWLDKYGGTADRKSDLRNQIADMEEISKLNRQSATRAAEGVQLEQEKTKWLDLQEKSLSKSEMRTKEIAKANALGKR